MTNVHYENNALINNRELSFSFAGSYDEKKHNEGNSKNQPNNVGPNFGSLHGSIGTINHNTQFSNTFGKPESNQVTKNNQIFNQIKNINRPISTSEVSKESSLTTHTYVSGYAPSTTSVMEEVDHSSGQSTLAGTVNTGKFEGTAIANTNDSSEIFIGQGGTKSEGVINSSVLFGQTEKFTSHSGELNHRNNSSIYKTNSGYEYKVPTITFESQNSNNYSQFENMDVQGIYNGFVVSKPDLTSDSISTQGLFNTQHVPTNSFQYTAQTEPTTNINVENFGTQTTLQVQAHKEFGQTIQPTSISSTGITTPSTSIINIQPSEDVLGISTKDMTKLQTQTTTGAVFINPTKTFTTLANYENSAYTQTQLPSFNFGTPEKHLFSFDVNKPSSTLSPQVTFAETTSTSYNLNKFSNNFTNSQLDGQFSLSSTVKSDGNDKTKVNTDMTQISEISSSHKSTQSKYLGNDKNVSNPIPPKEFIPNFFETSSVIPSPASPLNYLIQETSLENKGSLSVDSDFNMQTSAVFASSEIDKTKIQNVNGKHTAITAKPTQVQGLDNSYYYNKPLKPFVVPFKQNYDSLHTIQTGNQGSTSKSENILKQITSKESIKGTDIEKNFEQINQNQVKKPEYSQIVFENVQTQFEKTQFAKPSNTQNIKESEISQVQCEGLTNQQNVEQLYEYKKPIKTTITDKDANTSVGQFSESQLPQFSQTMLPVTQTLNSQKSPTSNFQSNSHFGQINPGTQAFKPAFDQTSQTSTTAINTQSIQTHTAFQPAKFSNTQSTFGSSQTGVLQFGAQLFKPSNVSQSQQSTGPLYQYSKPTEIVITNKGINITTGQVSETQSKGTQIDQTLPLHQTKQKESVESQKGVKNMNTLNNHNAPTSSFQASSQSGQTNFWLQTFKPAFGQKPETSTTFTNTQSIPTVIASQPATFTNVQSTFGSSQSKYGAMRFDAQHVKHPTIDQPQQTTGQLYEYKKPSEIVKTTKDTNIAFGQVSETESKVSQVDQILSISQTEENKSIQSQGAPTIHTLNTQNAPTSGLQANSQLGQTNVWSQTFQPTFGLKPQTSTTYTNIQSNQTQFAFQPAKFNSAQSKFGSSQSKYGVTQFGAQNFKTPISQLQHPTGQLYEYKKPLETITNNKGAISQIQFQGTQVEQLRFPSVDQVRPVQLSITSKTETSTSQKKPVSAFQSGSQFGNVQFGQTSFNRQIFKPTFDQTTQANTATTGSQYGILTNKPQLPLMQFVSQPTKATFGQSTFGTSQNKYGLTQIGTQKFKTSFTDQTQISDGELYEYKNPLKTTNNKESSIFIKQVNPAQSQIPQIAQTFSTAQGIQIKPIQQISQTNTTSAKIMGVQEENVASFQKSSQFDQVNFGNQNFKPTFGQTSQTSTTSTSSQIAQVASQPAFFGQSTFGSTQNKYGLTQFGAQKFKPSTSQFSQSTGHLYEYNKPDEVLTNIKDTQIMTSQINESPAQIAYVSQTSLPTIQSDQIQLVESQTGTKSAVMSNIPNNPITVFQSNTEFGQNNYDTQTQKPTIEQIYIKNDDFRNTKTIQGTEIGIVSKKPEVSGTAFDSKPAVTILEQEKLTKDTQNKFGVLSQGELHTQNKLTGILEVNKGAQLQLADLEDESVSKSNNQEEIAEQQYSGKLYTYNKPNIVSFTHKTNVTQSIESKIPESAGTITNPSNESQHSVEQAKFSLEQMLQTASTNTKIPDEQKETESTFGVSQATSNTNIGLQSTKPGFKQTIFKEQFDQAQFGVKPDTISLKNPSESITSEKGISILNTSQLTQKTQEGMQDSNISEAPIASQIQTTNTQAIVNTLGIPATNLYVNENQIGVGQNKPLGQNVQINSATIDTSDPQTQIGVQSTKPTCQSSQSEDIDNNKSVYQITEQNDNQDKLSFNGQVSHNDLLRPTTEQSSLSGQQLPHFGLAQIQNYHPHLHYQNDHPHSYDHSHFHGRPNHHDYPFLYDYHNHHGFYNHRRGPSDFNFRNHGFNTQFGYRQNKPYTHFNSGHLEKTQFEQSHFPFGNFGFLNKDNNFFNTYKNTATDGITTIKNNFAQNSITQTENPLSLQTKQPFGSTISSYGFTNAQKDSKFSLQPTKPTFVIESANQNQQTILANTGTKAQNQATTSTVISSEHSLPFDKPALQTFGGLINSDTNIKTTGPLSLAHASSGPSSIQLTGDSKYDNPHVSNAVAKAYSGNGFGQPNFASATANTNPKLSEFNVHGVGFQPFSTFKGYGSNAVAKAISGPQVGVNPIKNGSPSFSHAFASSNKDSSFASSFVSSTPVTTTTFSGKLDDTTFGSKLSTPVFGEVNTAKPTHGEDSLTIGSAEKFESLGGPREPPRFDRLTGYHY